MDLSLLKHTAANPNPNPNLNPNPNQVDLSLLKHKADRSFCEALLSRFSIEVGRRVSELELQQQQLVASIQARR